ncbi:threonine/serine dehydratase [Parvularcula sp. ZS-1/3]|uniref:Threonine/serine dehydratase n=1 Tax=Parvularcula mediterranea TaxID=2732508 RepID=A0A7Y3W4N4_9PROT|nr:threonine/serine dehydratase [Parvularcula mediterranea]NNU15638.1 threonine/serine dehydratase [Parvularcula mediterranea]
MADNASVTIEDIRAAEKRLAGRVVRTPVLSAPALDEAAGGRILAKAENLQGTGSFKLRGGLNHVLSLTEEEKTRGVVAYSSGNHAQGVARAAKLADVPAAIVMPADAPEAKRERTARDGAEVILYDRETESREEIAGRLAKERGAKLIPPFDHPLTIAGQGTAGLELTEQAAEPIGQLIVCCSGGGLASGMGLAVREAYPDCEIVVVEPEGFDDMARSLASEQLETNTRRGGSICDALLVETPGHLTLPILRSLDAKAVTVTDEEALAAMAFALTELKTVVEPGGAVALAAVLTGKVPTKGRTTAITLSGGNADPAMLLRALKTS